MKHPPQEMDLVPSRKLAVVGLVTVVATVAGVLVAYGIGDCASRQLAVRWTTGVTESVPPEVNAMETTTFDDEAQGLETNQRAEAQLHTYGWIDRDSRTVHVPIETAFEIYLERQRGRGGAR